MKLTSRGLRGKDICLLENLKGNERLDGWVRLKVFLREKRVGVRNEKEVSEKAFRWEKKVS